MLQIGIELRAQLVGGAERNGCLIFSRLPARRDLQEYFDHAGVVKGDSGARRFATLDDALQWAEDRLLADLRPASGDEAPLALVDFDLCREFTADQTLAALAACTEARSFAAGQLIFSAGDAADELYLIRRGVVRIVLPLGGGNYHNLASFGRGNFFGEVAFLDRGVRSANATATTAVDLFVISRARFDEQSRAQPLMGVKIFARLARTLALRLRRSDGELRAFYDT